MNIVIQSHHGTAPERARQQAARALAKLALRLSRPVSGVARFEEDGRMRRVELELSGRGLRLVAEGTGRYYGPALTAAIAHMEAQIRRRRGAAIKKRLRRAART